MIRLQHYLYTDPLCPAARERLACGIASSNAYSQILRNSVVRLLASRCRCKKLVAVIMMAHESATSSHFNDQILPTIIAMKKTSLIFANGVLSMAWRPTRTTAFKGSKGSHPRHKHVDSNINCNISPSISSAYVVAPLQRRCRKRRCSI